MSSNSRYGEQKYEGEDSSPASVINASGFHEGDGGAAYTTSRKGNKKAGAAGGGDDNEKDDGQQAVGRRKKKAVSCEGCRRRKLKCDRGWPVSARKRDEVGANSTAANDSSLIKTWQCGACRDRSEAHLCKWEGGTRPQATGRDQDNGPLLMRMDRIEQMLASIADKVGVSNDVKKVEQGPETSNSTRKSTSEHNRPTSGKEEASNGKKADPHYQEKSFLSTSWRPTTVDEARSELWHGLQALPDIETVRSMCRYYFDEVDYITYGECYIPSQ